MRNSFIAPVAMQSPSCPKSGNSKISGSYTQGVHPYTTNFVLCRKCSSPLSVTQHRYCCVGISSRPRQFILVAILWYLQNQQYRINGPVRRHSFNPLNAELNPICCLLELLGAHHFFHISRIRVKSLTLRLLMSYIYIWSAYS